MHPQAVQPATQPLIAQPPQPLPAVQQAQAGVAQPPPPVQAPLVTGQAGLPESGLLAQAMGGQAQQAPAPPAQLHVQQPQQQAEAAAPMQQHAVHGHPSAAPLQGQGQGQPPVGQLRRSFASCGGDSPGPAQPSMVVGEAGAQQGAQRSPSTEHRVQFANLDGPGSGGSTSDYIQVASLGQGMGLGFVGSGPGAGAGAGALRASLRDSGPPAAPRVFPTHPLVPSQASPPPQPPPPALQPGRAAPPPPAQPMVLQPPHAPLQPPPFDPEFAGGAGMR